MPEFDPAAERRRLWRHFAQCVLREDRARRALEDAVDLAGPDTAVARRYQAELDAKGVCTDAAIDALEDSLRPGVSAPPAAFPPALPVRTP